MPRVLTYGYIKEINKLTKHNSPYLEKGGTNVTLDGVQACAYARIRYTAGDDYKRAERQRTVLAAMVEKAQKSDLKTIDSLINAVFGDIQTSFSNTDLVALAAQIFNYKLGETCGFPFSKNATTYGQVAKKDLTGSVATVKMNDIKDVPVLSVDNALQGRIAGADFMSTTGEPGATTTIRIRGTRSINASNEPLIVVDGVMDAIHDLNDINSDDIAGISVLKDASSTAIYGSRGANGVILITTKRGLGSKPFNGSKEDVIQCMTTAEQMF